MEQLTGQSSISERFRKAGRKLTLGAGASLVTELNQILNSLLAGPFHVTSGVIKDKLGKLSDGFGTVIHIAAMEASPSAQIRIPANDVACVIDSYECLTLDNLRAAYKRIAKAKSLTKDAISGEAKGQQRNATVGIILAVNSTESLETVAEEVERLNQQAPCFGWPDMVVVLSKGAANYAVHFPCETFSGEFLLPEKPSSSNVPPVYVSLLMSPTGEYAFNGMCSFLLGHLWLFSPNSGWADRDEVKKHVPTVDGGEDGMQSGRLRMDRGLLVW